MDSGQLDSNSKCVEALSSEQLLPSDSSDISDIFGDPQVLPRVGKEYQVEIPSIISEFERLQLLRNPADTEIISDVSHYFLMGLPIPFMWVDDQKSIHENVRIGINKKPNDSANTNGSVGSKRANKSQLVLNKKALKTKIIDVALDDGRKLQPSSSEPAVAGETKPDQMFRSKSCCLVPGLLSESFWTDGEIDSFLFAIYIFEKNLVQVKRFMESKKMGEILSFYYGKFYGSDEHRRYSDCRRMMKSRKCKIGHRIFTGWTQQELLSRLLPHVSVEAKSTLVEFSKAFSEGRTSLEEYVHILKTAAGIPILIESVGIGKGKEGLTNLAMELTKNNQTIPTQPEIPVGKACSSLTCGDIIKFLTGDFRLSKARSNDIFWEAVWPRLLARGWHSEQPKNHGCYGSKHQLVFLMPGVKKFSRRKLMKGDHYFDSVSDVLSRVASEPKLIELEAEEPRVSSCKEENEREPETKLDHSDAADHQQHFYLKPRVSTFCQDHTKFTIVDTSLSCGENSLMVRELRSLPADTKNAFTLSIHSKETKGNSSVASMNEPQSADMILKSQKKTKYAKGIIDNSDSNQRMSINGPAVAEKLVANFQDQGINLSNDEQSRTIENKYSQSVRHGYTNVLPPLMKRQRLASCAMDDKSCRLGKFMVSSGLKEVKPSFVSHSPNVSEVNPLHETVLLGSSSAEGSLKKECHEGFLHGNIYDIEISPMNSEEPQPWPLIDLNVPPVPSDSDNGEFCMMEVDDSLQNPNEQVIFFSANKYELVDEPKVLSNSMDDNAAEKPPIVNPRRQSTRNRPLTTKALEALANGFLSTKRRRKGGENELKDNSVTRPSHRAHSTATVTSSSGNNSTGSFDDKEGNGVDGVWNVNKNRVSDSLVETERIAAQELVEISKAAFNDNGI